MKTDAGIAHGNLSGGLPSRSASLAKPQRCGRCRWWEGRRFRNDVHQTVSFSIEGRCGHSSGPAGAVRGMVHYLGGIDCPLFEMWAPAPPQPVAPR